MLEPKIKFFFLSQTTAAYFLSSQKGYLPIFKYRFQDVLIFVFFSENFFSEWPHTSWERGKIKKKEEK